MAFEKMIGTTGVTTDGINLYVANNTDISVINQNGSKTDYKHSYENVSVLTVGKNALYGIYKNGSVKGLFQMEMTTYTFRSFPVQYNPVFIYFLNNSATDILVFDDTYQIYRYDASLALKTTKGTPLPESLKPSTFTTFIMTQAKDTSYYAINDKIINLDTLQPLPLSIQGNIWGIHYYMDCLFILYISDFSQYSILQYNPVQNKEIKTLQGGLVTGPSFYSCIYKNNVLVSATVNKSFSLTLFEVPGITNPTVVNSEPDNTNANPYPLFELVKNEPIYLDETVERKIEDIQKNTHSLEMDMKPAEKAYLSTYLWGFILVLLIGLFIWVVGVKETTMIHHISLAILVVSIVFIVYRYILY